MNLLSEGMEYGEEPRPFEDHHVNQWRYLPQFCGHHFSELVILGRVTGFRRYDNPMRLLCDVDGCLAPAERKENYASKVDFGGE